MRKMQQSNNTTNEGFLKAYSMLPACEQTNFRDSIMAKCGWSKRSFYMKVKGESQVTELEKEYLQGVFAEWNIDFETGNYIKTIA